MKNGWYKMLVFGDRHVPSNDKRIDNILIDIIKKNKDEFKYIIDLGDGLDADCISKYDKSHNQLKGLQNELDDDYAFRKEINKACPKATKILLTCNHFTARWNQMMSKEYWMVDLEALQQENLFRLKELNWNLKSEWIWGKNRILFMHGDGALGSGSQKSIVNCARDLVKENAISIVRGHSHTTGYEVHKKFGKYYHAIQVGTMYDLRVAPNYVKSGQYLSNWSNSFGIFYCSPDNDKFLYTPVIIDNGEAVFEGELYGTK